MPVPGRGVCVSVLIPIFAFELQSESRTIKFYISGSFCTVGFDVM